MCDQFGTGFGANLASEFVKFICRELCYAFKYKSHVKDLDKRVKEIIAKRDREQKRVDHAIKQADYVIHKDVEQWLMDVDQFILHEAYPITAEDDRAKSLCFKGCPNLITRYKFSKKAVKAANDGANLVGKSFSTVSYRLPPERTSSMYGDRGYVAFDSRECILQEIMEALKDANVNRIGVHGMGGVGKTTLVNKVAWLAKKDKLFDDVAIAEVTQKPDNRKIQDKIAFDLGLEFEQRENEYVRADRLRNKLKKGKRVLVVLDNIWAKPDFKAIGIPFGGDEERIAAGNEHCRGINDDQSQRVYKILLTSRRSDILCNEMKTGKNFHLETFSDKEAQNLFWKIVGDHSVENSDFRTVGEEIVKKCAGLPLGVETIANALKNKIPCTWKDALGKLKASNPRSIPEMDEKLFSVIEVSFSLLQNDEAKSLLLLCSLIDTGRGMSVDYLLRYGMGWGLFKDVYTLEEGRNRVHALIDHLKASSLLLAGDSNSGVKMHEVVHAVAASIASTNEFMFNIQDVPNLNIVLEDKISKNPTAISLPFRDISWLPERLGCPKLELLFLFMKSEHSLQIPDSFFEGMKKLKVIDFDGINLLSLPSSFGYLTSLQTLCLDGCTLGEISTIGELKNLQILSLSRSNIEQLPEKIGQLTRLQLLDLSYCSSLKVIQANVISRLSRLEELYLDNSSVRWESGHDNQEGSNANLSELNKLSLLTTLNICFSDAKIIPPNLSFQQLNKFKILIGDVFNWSHRNEAPRTLKLKLNYNSLGGYKPIKILLKRTEDLFLDELNGIQNVFYELDEEGFLNLKHLHVHNCSELLYIVNSAGRIHYNAFPKLELLCLINLVNLEKIWHGPLKETSFNKLKVIRVNKCDGLMHLFTMSMASLSQLQEMEVTNCKKLKVIFSDEDNEGRVHNQNAVDRKIKFPQLRTLDLEHLPQFTSFSFNVKTLFATNTASSEITTADDHEYFKTLFHEKVEYPSLENLKLSSISIEKIWPEQLLSIASYSQTLKRLTLENCNGLKFLFSSSTVKRFAHLQHLEVCNCVSMLWVLDAKGQGGAEEIVSFPKLFFLELKDLANITRFGNGNIIEFPLLNALLVENCPNLRTFFSNNTCTDMTLSNEPGKMNLVENLQAAKQSLFGDKVGFPSLEVLMVCQMQNLRKIWDDQLSLYSFCKIKVLVVKDCSKLLNIFPSAMLERLQRLENLEVMSCDSLEEVFELQVVGDQMTPVVAATQLRELHVCHLPNLKHVWNKDAQAILAFENLIRIRVHTCQSLKNLFPASMANGLLKLEELDIESCLLEEIVAMQDKVDEAVIPRFVFPRLNSLRFCCLPVLNSFYPERHISEWPVLKKMEVSGCTTGCGRVKILASELQSQPDHLQSLFLVDKVAFPSLEELKVSYLPELLHLWGENSQSRGFQNLETLELSVCKKIKTLTPSSLSLWFLETLNVSKCDELISLVTLSTAKSLVNLRRINISDCKKIEEIITHEGDLANNDDQIVLKQLNYLGLHHLPSLTCFCHLGNYVIDFPSLEKVIVGHCPKMVMLERVVLKEGGDKGCWQGNLDSSGQELLKEMVGFQGLKYLKISEFPQLKKVWHDQLLPGNFFSNLTSLAVDQCVDMSCAISANLLQFLNNLEMLEIQNCDSLEQVFDLEELSVHGNGGLLFQLSHFYLLDLPRLSHICRSHQNILGFKNLKFLEVYNCGGLRYIFGASMFSGLKKLQEMKIINCAKLEVIITTEGEEDATDKIVLPQLNSIILESLPELTSFYSGSNVLECPSLQTITLTNCTEMEAFVFSDTKNHHLHTPSLLDQVSFPKLETLTVCNMDNLRKIWDNDQLNLDSSSQLRSMRVDNCNKLLNIFPAIIQGRRKSQKVLKVGFPSLNKVEVTNCDSVERVLHLEELNADEHLGSLFPKLMRLMLSDLPNLKSFCCFNGIIELPSLCSLTIEYCPNMETFISNFIPVCMATNKESEEGTSEKKFIPDLQPLFDEKVAFPKLKRLYLRTLPKLHLWKENALCAKGFQNLKSLTVLGCPQLEKLMPSSMSLQNLTTLEVWDCNKLKNLLTRATAESLVKLTKMLVSGSLMIENIIELQDGEELKADPIIFCELEYLKLNDLPRLESFCLGNYPLDFPYLIQVVVSGCPSMKIFSQGVLHTPKLHKMQLTDNEERWEGNLNCTIQKLFKEMFLNNLHRLVLRNCDSVEEVFHLEELNGDELLGPLFPKLAHLCLIDLPKLSRFCNFNGNKIEPPSLSNLHIKNCPNMETFISNSTPVHMTANKELQEITTKENSVANIQPLFDGKVAFPNLETLLLDELPKLSHLWKENSHPSNFFQNLETLKLLGCHKLEKLVPPSLSFQNLTTLEVINCDGLRNLVTYATAESLVKLTRMKISDCKMIEEIIQQLEEEVKKDCFNFSQLKYLELDCLPSLMCFWSGNYTVFPSLKQVIVKECSKMKIFSQEC